MNDDLLEAEKKLCLLMLMRVSCAPLHFHHFDNIYICMVKKKKNSNKQGAGMKK